MEHWSLPIAVLPLGLGSEVEEGTRVQTTVHGSTILYEGGLDPFHVSDTDFVGPYHEGNQD